MPINRAWFTALVDDTGTGTTGTVWNKAAISGLLDAIDGMVEVNKVWTPSLKFGGANTGWVFRPNLGSTRGPMICSTLEATIIVRVKGIRLGRRHDYGITLYPQGGDSTRRLGRSRHRVYRIDRRAPLPHLGDGFVFAHAGSERHVADGAHVGALDGDGEF